MVNCWPHIILHATTLLKTWSVPVPWGQYCSWTALHRPGLLGYMVLQPIHWRHRVQVAAPPSWLLPTAAFLCCTVWLYRDPRWAVTSSPCWRNRCLLLDMWTRQSWCHNMHHRLGQPGQTSLCWLLVGSTGLPQTPPVGEINVVTNIILYIISMPFTLGPLMGMFCYHNVLHHWTLCWVLAGFLGLLQMQHGCQLIIINIKLCYLCKVMQYFKALFVHCIPLNTIFMSILGDNNYWHQANVLHKCTCTCKSMP